MKGIPWVPAQDDALRAGWANPNIRAEDIADVLMVPFQAARSRALKLGLPRKAYSPPKPKLLESNETSASVLVPGAGGQIVLIDVSDLEWFLSYPIGWYAHRQNSGLVYVKTRDLKSLHRLLINAAVGDIVDHINRNGLDNRRSNLRIVDDRQNNYNSGPRRHARSAYKGVWRHVDGLYGGAIKGPEGRRLSIGYYATEVEAARAHDALAKLFRGEFAFLNLPDDPLTIDEIMNLPALRRHYQRLPVAA